ncbi:G5 domain protein [Bifidobacterium minimum]|uniref:G5 domain protein n=1 Tax=Bifidobacterium minimum TaxID=1693 RepID=A0A087BSB5_9BIFI|nr:G5 domain-containing protein [Bifidobacterium minimum]KFI73915.1 G5 domain protein [Bifidobacterium minimum]
MANHRRRRTTLTSLSKKQWVRIVATLTAVGLLASGAAVSRNFYAQEQSSKSRVTAYSATDSSALDVSRGYDRQPIKGLKAGTAMVTVTINGKSRVVLGTKFTDVKSVLDAGDITLDPDDTISPSLTTKVSESTSITITRASADLQTSTTSIAFNVVRKTTSALPKGTEQVKTQGVKGVMETTSLVTRSGSHIVESNIFTSYVKKAPVDEVILVGTGTTSSSSSSSSSSAASTDIGTTTPVGDMQKWAHDYMLSNGYTEADFTATVYIISHESGWRVNAVNPSGAYGLPQALPGSKMASAGSDWATNYQTQLKWFWGYCAQRYGSVQGAYSYWQAHSSY